VKSGVPVVGTYVNADDIKKATGCSDLEAAQEAESVRESLLESHANFTFETVLSTDRNLNLISRAKDAGYEITSIFILTVNPSVNVARVRTRVASGGHDVPEAKIRSRFEHSLANLPALVSLSDTCIVIDNTGDDPVPIFVRDHTGCVVTATPDWSKEQVNKLVGW